MSALSPAALSDARILACVIFLASYVVFALGKVPGLKIDRTGAAIIGAVGMVAFRVVRPGEGAALYELSDHRAAIFDDADRREPAPGGLLRVSGGRQCES